MFIIKLMVESSFADSSVKSERVLLHSSTIVKSRKSIGFEFMVTHHRLLIIKRLLPYLTPWDLAKFVQYNKSCNQLLDPKGKYWVNYVFLLEAWGIKLTHREVKEILVSTAVAL
jgi:hypothetical protein